MTKKHFIDLADQIRHENVRRLGAGLPPMFDGAAIESLADFCWQQNRRFNRSRWINYIEGACGPNGGTIKTNPRTGMEATDPSDSLL
jgi:hypothetical protein